MTSKSVQRDAGIRVLRDIGNKDSFLLRAPQNITREQFTSLVDMNRPILFSQYAMDWDCVTKWQSRQYIEEHARLEEVLMPGRTYQVFRGDQNGKLGLTSGTSERRRSSLRQFIDSEKYDYLLGLHDSSTFCPVQPHHLDPPGTIPPLSRDVPHTNDLLSWFGEYFGARFGTDTRVWDHQQFFLAKQYSFTDLHYDSYYNFYFACCGTRKWTIAPPSATAWLQTKTGKYSNRSEFVPHLGKFTNSEFLADFPFLYIELSPGDVLFVPAFWWHLVESVPNESGLSIAYNYFFSTPPEVIFDELEKAQKSTEMRIKRRLHILKATRKPRSRLTDSVVSPLLTRLRENRRVRPIVIFGQPYNRWSPAEEAFLHENLSEYWGQWEALCVAGRGIFNRNRTGRQILEKVRRDNLKALSQKKTIKN